MIQQIKVQGKSYHVCQKLRNIIEYFSSVQVIQQQFNSNQIIQINAINIEDWEQVTSICQKIEYQFPPVPKVSTNDSEEVIGKLLTTIFSNKTFIQINKLYRVAHFFKITGLKKCIAAYLATKVYVRPTLKDFQKRKKQLNVTVELTSERCQQMRSCYAFLN